MFSVIASFSKRRLQNRDGAHSPIGQLENIFPFFCFVLSTGHDLHETLFPRRVLAFWSVLEKKFITPASPSLPFSFIMRT